MKDSNHLDMYALGPLERHQGDGRFTFRATFVYGRDYYLANFTDGAEAAACGCAIDHIKNYIEAINEDFEAKGRADEDAYKQRLGKEWLPIVAAFVNEWGSTFVPGDVRVAVDDVEANLDIPRRAWPAFPKVTALGVTGGGDEE